MWFFAGKKSEQILLEYGGSSLDFNSATTRASFLSALSTNYGISTSDISFFVVGDSSTEVTRIRNGDSWALAWSNGMPSGVISSISFAAEDAKKWLQFTADKTTVLANNKDLLTVSVSVLTANKSGIDTTFSGDLDIPVITPNGGVKARFTFYTGKAAKTFKFDKAGTFKIGYRQTSYRIDNTVSAEVLIQMALLDNYNLAVNATLRNRIAAAVAKASFDVLNEDPGTAYHAERVVWAKASLKDPVTVTDQMAWTVVQDTTIQSHGLDSTDIEIQNAVNGNINRFAV
jgi:hypothetical protein